MAPRTPSPLSRQFIILLLVVAIILPTISGRGFEIEEATIDGIHRAFESGELTATQLVRDYLDRIRALNPALRAVVEVDRAGALDRAARLDRAGWSGPVRGLRGIPVLLKDNIGTRGPLNTTAGSLALLGAAPFESGAARRLLRAGAVVVGKASLSEWANFRSFTAPNGWSARGGQGRNPYVLSADPCGSSSGSAIAVAANMVAVTLGTETDGSIICPAAANSVVGIKPTVGLTSRAGVIPISPRQDTVFLMAQNTSGIGPVERSAISRMNQLSEEGIEMLMMKNQLDAVITPDATATSILAIGGYPGISVPAGYDKTGVPFGICFGGLKGSEPKLIEIAYAFEQATAVRKPPTFKSSVTAIKQL